MLFLRCVTVTLHRSSAWKECVAKGEVWGGRAKGGRGIRLNGGFTTDVSVDGVEITFAGNELLTNAKYDLRWLHVVVSMISH